MNGPGRAHLAELAPVIDLAAWRRQREERNMTKNALTPSPWRYEPAPGARTWGRVLGADGTEVAAAVGEADGVLLAEAPELLEALRGMVARFDTGDGSDTIGPGLSEAEAAAIRRARAAIARAAPGLRIVAPPEG